MTGSHVIDGCDAGLALHRLAVGSPQLVAIDGDPGPLRWQELGRAAHEFAEHLDGDPGSADAVLVEADSLVEDVIGTWGVLLGRRPLFVAAPGAPREMWDWRLQRSHAPGPAAADPSARIPVRPPRDMSRPAVAVQSRSAPSRAWVWSHGDLLRLWASMSPRPGSISLAAEPHRGPLHWATVQSALLGRGRVVLAEGSWRRRLTAVDGLDVDDLQVAADALPELLDAATVHRKVRRVVVWSEGHVELAVLDAVATAFPGADVLRCLAAPWGPLAVARRADLHEVGARWLGEPVLGAEVMTHGAGPRRRLLVDSLFAGGPVDPEEMWRGGAPGAVDTGLLVEADGWGSAGGGVGSESSSGRDVLLLAAR